MSTAEPIHVPSPTVRNPARSRPQDRRTRSILDTTEVRWFVPGPLPDDVAGWFDGEGGVLEERYDTYVLDGRSDVGVKRRFGETLEMKVRLSPGRWVDLGEGLTGSREVWRRWSPADGLPGSAGGGQRVDVHKSIVKRRFSPDGSEIAYSHGVDPNDAGCDAEIAAITIGTARAWTFACAAFGPPATRDAALLASWKALSGGGPAPPSFVLPAGGSMGYPAWLTRTSNPDRRP